MLSDFYVTFPFIVLFGLLAFLLSFLTKYIIDQKELIKTSINTFFGLSTIGFFVLGVLFLFRVINIASAKPPNDKDVMGNKDELF